jgi:hypothetical protein
MHWLVDAWNLAEAKAEWTNTPKYSFLIHFQHFLIAEKVITLQKRKNRETYLRLRWLSCDWINKTESTNSKMMPRTASSKHGQE